ncbi:hypothetical protein ET141_29950, partial [Klebsiella pneumoniae]
RGLCDVFKRQELEIWKFCVIALNVIYFYLSSQYGRMLATFLSGIAEFERDLISERVKAGLDVATVSYTPLTLPTILR